MTRLLEDFLKIILWTDLPFSYCRHLKHPTLTRADQWAATDEPKITFNCTAVHLVRCCLAMS
jgi:hypothetical protein